MAIKKLIEVWDGKNLLKENIKFLKKNTKEVPWVKVTAGHFIQKCPTCIDYGLRKKATTKRTRK